MKERVFKVEDCSTVLPKLKIAELKCSAILIFIVIIDIKVDTVRASKDENQGRDQYIPDS